LNGLKDQAFGIASGRPVHDPRLDEKPATSIRVLVVDDHALVRTGISAILRQHPDIEVVGEAANAEAALTCVRRTLVDVAILDLRLGVSRNDGLELAGAIWEAASAVRVVLYSNYVGDECATLLEGANVYGVVLKTDHPRTLVDAVRAAAGRVTFISPDAWGRIART
jgi:DNA-binding NarL/FixJ family response regulator